MKNPILPLLALAALSASVAQAGPKHGGKWIVGMSQCNLGEPWRVQMNADIRKAAEAHPEMELVFKDAQNDTLRQRAQIEEFVNADVDLLIVSPKEAAPLTPPVAAAFRHGIPVIVLDRKVLGSDFTQFIGADNRRIGRAAGEWAVRKLLSIPQVKARGRARIVEITGLMTSTPGQDRLSGFHAALQGQPVDIVFTADSQWLEPQARSEMESALAVNPQIDLVYAHNDPSAHGAYLAAKAAGRENEIIFVGIDGLPQEGQVYVRQGLLEASFEYPTGGREAVESALKILRGEAVPAQVTLNSRFFTRDNVARGGEWLP
jgi:ribose transport system substrate-binding protein